MTSTVTDERIVTSTSEPDSAHIVMVPPDEDDETPQAYVMRARIEGFPVTALCGFTWIPHRKAEGLPVCQKCLEIYQTVGSDLDQRGNLPDE